MRTTWILDKCQIVTPVASYLKEPTICVNNFPALRCVRLAHRFTKTYVTSLKIEATWLRGLKPRHHFQGPSIVSLRLCNILPTRHSEWQTTHCMLNALLLMSRRVTLCATHGIAV